MTLSSEELSELLRLVKDEWEHATLEADIEFYCNLYLNNFLLFGIVPE